MSAARPCAAAASARGSISTGVTATWPKVAMPSSTSPARRLPTGGSNKTRGLVAPSSMSVTRQKKRFSRPSITTKRPTRMSSTLQPGSSFSCSPWLSEPRVMSPSGSAIKELQDIHHPLVLRSQQARDAARGGDQEGAVATPGLLRVLDRGGDEVVRVGQRRAQHEAQIAEVGVEQGDLLARGLVHQRVQ